jgi:DNA-binding transcriptional LysR family regulator
VWPALEKLLADYPDIHVALDLDSGFTEIVTERFDAGARLGKALANDMVATRIGPGSPAQRRRSLCVGIGEGRSRVAGARRGAACLR